MFELNNEPYEFESPPAAHWLPSPYLMFEAPANRAGCADQEQVAQPDFSMTPDPLEIRDQCERLRASWSQWERELRRIRATIALELGVCRNH